MITIRSGEFKNKKLQIPPVGVRPTSDKIRQAIFNVLMHADFAPPMANARVLDAFAGTGAMGLEALSRGAAHAWFMENDPAVGKILQQNLAIAAARATLLVADAGAPERAPEGMNMVFLDPPYSKNLLLSAVSALQAAEWISEKTLLIIETAAQEALLLPEDYVILDQRKYGNTRINFATLSRK